VRSDGLPCCSASLSLLSSRASESPLSAAAAAAPREPAAATGLRAAPGGYAIETKNRHNSKRKTGQAKRRKTYDDE
jgi:hypothetical protein